MTEFPNVVGFNVGEAETFLRELGFLPSHRLTPHGTVEADVVIQQTPGAGTLLGPQAPVSLLVSGGPPDPPVDLTPREVIPPETLEPPLGLEPVSDPSQRNPKDY
jgi:beta-lactam-binding protein with PASTA domain